MLTDLALLLMVIGTMLWIPAAWLAHKHARPLPRGRGLSLCDAVWIAMPGRARAVFRIARACLLAGPAAGWLASLLEQPPAEEREPAPIGGAVMLTLFVPLGVVGVIGELRIRQLDRAWADDAPARPNAREAVS